MMTLLDQLNNVYTRLQRKIPTAGKFSAGNHRWGSGLMAGVIILIILIQLVFGFLWNTEPEQFDVVDHAAGLSRQHNEDMVTGYITTATLIKTGEILLDKSGGYLSNDVTPPGLLMDNIPNLEFGVLVQIRDLSRTMRNDISRSQSQSIEDKDMIIAEPQFSVDSSSWMLPAAESEYDKALNALTRYLHRLTDADQQDGQFYARADNLSDWLGQVEKRLGSLSQRLSASVG